VRVGAPGTEVVRMMAVSGAMQGGGRRAVQGYALMMALLLVVLVSLATMVAVQNERQKVQREREAELLFVGSQFRSALQSYFAFPSKVPQYPASLQDLLEDHRSPNVVRHLRRIYPDPMTGQADWVLEKQQGRIVGIHSRSTQAPLKNSGFAMSERDFVDAATYAQWRFRAVAGVADTAAAGTATGLNATAPSVSTSPGASGSDSGSGSNTAGSSSGTPDTPQPPSNNSQIANCIQQYIYPQNNCNEVPPPAGSNYTSCRAALQEQYASCVSGNP